MKLSVTWLFLVITSFLCKLVSSNIICKVFSDWTIDGKNPILERKGNVVVMSIISARNPKTQEYSLYALNNFAVYTSAVAKRKVKVLAVNLHTKEPVSSEFRAQYPYITIYNEPDGEDWKTLLGVAPGDVLVFDKCGRMTFQYMAPYSRFTYPFVSNAISYTIDSYRRMCGYCNIPSATSPPVTKRTTDFLSLIRPDSDSIFVPGHVPKVVSISNEGREEVKTKKIIENQDRSDISDDSNLSMKDEIPKARLVRVDLQPLRKDSRIHKNKMNNHSKSSKLADEMKNVSVEKHTETSIVSQKPWTSESIKVTSSPLTTLIKKYKTTIDERNIDKDIQDTKFMPKTKKISSKGQEVRAGALLNKEKSNKIISTIKDFPSVSKKIQSIPKDIASKGIKIEKTRNANVKSAVEKASDSIQTSYITTSVPSIKNKISPMEMNEPLVANKTATIIRNVALDSNTVSSIITDVPHVANKIATIKQKATSNAEKKISMRKKKRTIPSILNDIASIRNDVSSVMKKIPSIAKKEPFSSNKIPLVIPEVLELEKAENNLMMDYILKKMRSSVPQKDSFHSKSIELLPAESDSPSITKREASTTKDVRPVLSRYVSMKKWENDLVLNYLLQKYAVN